MIIMKAHMEASKKADEFAQAQFDAVKQEQPPIALTFGFNF